MKQSGVGRCRPAVDLAFPVVRPALTARHAATGRGVGWLAA
jgi:hypothetical protein